MSPGNNQRFIGEIIGFHGLRGDVKVKANSENPDWLNTLKKVTWIRGDKTLELDIIRARKKASGSVILAFANYRDRTHVEAELAQGKLYADDTSLPQPNEAEGEYWASDLVGLTVIDKTTQAPIGVVLDLLTSGGRDFLEIQLPGKKQTLLIPFIDEFFPTVNLDTKHITVARLSEFIDESTQKTSPKPPKG